MSLFRSLNQDSLLLAVDIVSEKAATAIGKKSMAINSASQLTIRLSWLEPSLFNKVKEIRKDAGRGVSKLQITPKTVELQVPSRTSIQIRRGASHARISALLD